jgi:hypothetical protein
MWTYELESDAASFDTADRDVEEAAGALFNLLVHLLYKHVLKSHSSFESFEVSLLVSDMFAQLKLQYSSRGAVYGLQGVEEDYNEDG